MLVAAIFDSLRLRLRNLYIFKNTMAKSKIVWFGMKLTPEQKQKIRYLAEREGVSAKEALMRLVDRALLTKSWICQRIRFSMGSNI